MTLSRRRSLVMAVALASSADLASPDLLAARLVAEAASLDLFERLAAARTAIGGPLVFTTSFGLEDQAIGRAILSQGLDIDVVTLDTGRLFQQTHDVWAETERRYGRRIRAIVPDRPQLEALVERLKLGTIRDDGTDAAAVAPLSFGPDIMGLLKQAAGVERHDVDIQALAENGAADGLVFQTEAGGEDERSADGGAGGRQALEQVERGRFRD